VARRWVAKKWEEWAIRDDVSVVKCILRLSSVDTKVPYPRAAQVALKAENIDSYWSVTITCAHKKSLPACGSGRPPGGTAPGGAKRVPTRGPPIKTKKNKPTRQPQHREISTMAPPRRSNRAPKPKKHYESIRYCNGVIGVRGEAYSTSSSKHQSSMPISYRLGEASRPMKILTRKTPYH
jgi:hypothetical protein